jgi:hypothetical protein
VSGKEVGEDEEEDDEDTRSMLKKSSKEEKDGGGWSGESTSMVVAEIVEVCCENDVGLARTENRTGSSFRWPNSRR